MLSAMSRSLLFIEANIRAQAARLGTALWERLQPRMPSDRPPLRSSGLKPLPQIPQPAPYRATAL